MDHTHVGVDCDQNDNSTHDLHDNDDVSETYDDDVLNTLHEYNTTQYTVQDETHIS